RDERRDLARRAFEPPGALGEPPRELDARLDRPPARVAGDRPEAAARTHRDRARGPRHAPAVQGAGGPGETSLPRARFLLGADGKHDALAFGRVGRGALAAVRTDPARGDVEPVVFLGREGDHRLAESALDRAQRVAVRALLLGALLLLDQG